MKYIFSHQRSHLRTLREILSFQFIEKYSFLLALSLSSTPTQHIRSWSGPAGSFCQLTYISVSLTLSASSFETRSLSLSQALFLSLRASFFGPYVSVSRRRYLRFSRLVCSITFLLVSSHTTHQTVVGPRRKLMQTVTLCRVSSMLSVSSFHTLLLPLTHALFLSFYGSLLGPSSLSLTLEIYEMVQWASDVDV